MEQKETTTQQLNSPNLDDSLNSMEADKIISTPTSASSWWGGWVAQAKEKVIFFVFNLKSDGEFYFRFST